MYQYVPKGNHNKNAALQMRKTQAGMDLDKRLDDALGKPENLSAYQDCIQGARAGWRDPLRVLVVALALLMTPETADAAIKRLAIDLDWKHVPRDPGESVHQSAEIPGGRVEFIRRSSLRRFTIHTKTGFCSTVAEDNEIIDLSCGTDGGFYSLVQANGGQAAMDWVTDQPDIVRGESS